MIVKTRSGIIGSAKEPIALILTKEEKMAITNMPEDGFIVAFYPTNAGYTPELIQAWMQEGLQPIQPVAMPASKQTIDVEAITVEEPKV